VGKSRAFCVLNLDAHELTAGLKRVMSRGQGDLLRAFECVQLYVP